ncbi:DUF6069 family protein [Kitasatospora sp. NPDC088346]|uniref:DUF6069 family protein n=1 Tax=Kitasatospora sp. NPDC088346 TaxID=3364073 RepID=UPI0037FE3DF3
MLRPGAPTSSCTPPCPPSADRRLLPERSNHHDRHSGPVHPHPTDSPGQLLRPVAICVGLVANHVYLSVLDHLGYDLKTPAEFGQPARSVLVDLASAFTVVPALAGWGALELLERFMPRRAVVTWTVLALAVLIGGFPWTGAGISTTDRILLAQMQLIVGAAVIPTFVISSRRRRS